MRIPRALDNVLEMFRPELLFDEQTADREIYLEDIEGIEERAQFRLTHVCLTTLSLKEYNRINRNLAISAYYLGSKKPKRLSIQKIGMPKEDLEEELKFVIYMRNCNTGFEYRHYKNKSGLWIAEAVPGIIDRK